MENIGLKLNKFYIANENNDTIFILNTHDKEFKMITKEPYIETKYIPFIANNKKLLLILNRFNNNDSLIFYGLYNYGSKDIKVSFDKLLFQKNIKYIIATKEKRISFIYKNDIKDILTKYNKYCIKTNWNINDLKIFLNNMNNIVFVNELYKYL